MIKIFVADNFKSSQTTEGKKMLIVTSFLKK
jgi:hypothetical protein